MITAKMLRKEFGEFCALNGLNMNVKAGEVYGFIGQNGSGKTTTMNILCGLSSIEQGECYVNGKDIKKLIHPGDLNIGYLPENPKFYPWMNAYETLHYLSDARKGNRIEEILNWTGLWEARNRRVGGFSRGMKQRLGIGAALIRNPNLLILDEPSSALDPEGRSEVLRLIKDLKDMGKTILFSTHILDDVERVCDTVGMIDRGRMLFEKSLSELQRTYAQPLFDIIPVHLINPDILDRLEQLPGVVALTRQDKRFTIKVDNNEASTSVMRFLVDHEIIIESFAIRKVRLEDLFLQGVNAN